MKKQLELLQALHSSQAGKLDTIRDISYSEEECLRIQKRISNICNRSESDVPPQEFSLTDILGTEPDAEKTDDAIIAITALAGADAGDNFMRKLLTPLFQQYYKDFDDDTAAQYAYLKSNIVKKMYNNSDQFAYAGWMHLMSKKAGSLLEQWKDKSITFDSLLEQLGAMRYIQAQAVQSAQENMFGRLRGGGDNLFTSNLNSAYTPFFRYYLTKLKSKRKNEMHSYGYAFCLLSDSNAIMEEGKLYLSLENGQLCYSCISLDGSKIEKVPLKGASNHYTPKLSEPLTNEHLSRFNSAEIRGILKITSENGHTHGPYGAHGDEIIDTIYVVAPLDEKKIIGTQLQVKEGMRLWKHASPSVIVEIKGVFEAWTKHILETDYTNKKDQLIHDVAYWYHTSVQGTFYARGSSAITQTLFVALCKIKNISPPKFIQHVDCWALCMQPDVFEREIFHPWLTKQPIKWVHMYQNGVSYEPNVSLSPKEIIDIILFANELETDPPDWILHDIARYAPNKLNDIADYINSLRESDAKAYTAVFEIIKYHVVEKFFTTYSNRYPDVVTLDDATYYNPTIRCPNMPKWDGKKFTEIGVEDIIRAAREEVNTPAGSSSSPAFALWKVPQKSMRTTTILNECCRGSEIDLSTPAALHDDKVLEPLFCIQLASQLYKDPQQSPAVASGLSRPSTH